MRKFLLPLLALTATLSIVTHGLEAAGSPAGAPPTRLGTAIREDAAQREKALAERARAVELRARAAQAIEKRLAEEESAAAAPAPARGGQAAADEPGPYDSLASIYAAMKPARAAEVFQRLDLEVQVEVARRMRERSTALILARMDPAAAAALSMALAKPGARPSASAPKAAALAAQAPAAP